MLTSATLSLEPVSRETLHLWTDEVVEGLEKVLRKCPDDWGIPDVWLSLYASRSTLWIMRVDGVYNGFCILEPAPCPFTRKMRVNIWALYSKKLHLEQLADRLREVCKGADSIRFFSPRKWERRLRGLMTQGMTIFEAKL